MNKKKLTALILSLASTATFAGTMGPMPAEKLLFIEGGLAYSHGFLKSNHVSPESRTAAFPGGFSYDPSNVYPNDYWGGYIGASLFCSDWLVNMRLDMFSAESKYTTGVGTIKLAPGQLSFTLDRVMGDINSLSYGIGAGAVVEVLNEGSFIAHFDGTNPQPPSNTLQRSRIDPQIEGFVMYRMDNNVGIKFNLGYQFPVNHDVANGDLNLNLGINYSFPV